MLILASLFFLLPRDQLIEALSGFSAGMWLCGISIYPCLHLIGVAKWRMLINAAGAGIGFAHAARCYYYGLFGNTFLPSVIGGDIVRAGLAMKSSHSKGAILLGSVADRAIDSIGLALVAGIGALLIPMALDENSRSIFWGFAVLVVTACAGSGLLLWLLPARRFPFRMRRKLVKLRLAARSLATHPLKVLIALGSVLVLQTALVIMNLWLGRLALIQNATFLMWLFVWPLAKLAAMVPVTQGGIGVREAAQGMLFVPLGVSIEKAVATGLIFQTILIGGNLLCGVLALLLGRVSPPAPAIAPASVRNGAHAPGIVGAFVMGGVVFFGVNTLALAFGTGSVGAAWVEWMALVPGLDASFTGSLVGFAYAAVPGYLLGRLVGNPGIPGIFSESFRSPEVGDKVDLPVLVRNPLKRLGRKILKKSFIVPEYHQMKCVFVHIPKNAGTSVKKTLFGQARITHRLAMDYYRDEPDAYAEYFTFAFSRNPYDRVVSAYHYLMQGGKNDGDKQFLDAHLCGYENFADFVTRGLGRKEIMKYWHFMPQYLFVVDFDGKKMVDFIGRFENISEDFRYISQRIGVDKELPLLNESSRIDYRSFYTPELAHRVWDIYQRDFELFGYPREL